jgi:hypothetical protein
MNFKFIYYIIIIFISATIGCGAPDESNTGLSGNIEIPVTLIGSAKGPLFVAVSKSDNIESIMNDPVNNILYVSAVDRSKMSFSFSLSDAGLQSGDRIFLFAFADNDYKGGVPYPTPGDIVGFYVNQETLSTSFRLSDDGNNVLININRMQYNISPEIIGIIDSIEPGEVTLIAYAGDFSSTDFTSLNVNAVIGYKKIHKGNQPCQFNLDIMPYGYNTPIQGVYVIALLDRNGNGIPDGGDAIGFPVESETSSYPLAITVTNGTVAIPAVKFKVEVADEPDSSLPPLRIIGSFNPPDGYNADSKPVSIVVVKGTDPNTVFENLKYLENFSGFYYSILPAGDTEFDIALPRTDFAPGDNVFVIALWDKDFTSGIPKATQNDMIGFLQNKNSFEYSIVLQDNDNNIVRTADEYTVNGTSGYSFAVDRIMYEHEARIKFKLEKGSLSDAEFANGSRVIITAVWETGTVSTGYEITMDKIIASVNVIISHDIGAATTDWYTMPVIPALYKDIPAVPGDDLMINNVWILAVLDSNGNGKPDTGEKIGFYWKSTWLIFTTIYEPDKLPAPLADGTTFLQKTIRFSNNTY